MTMKSFQSFAGSFLDILFGQYVRRGMGKKLPPKMRNELVVTSFHAAFLPMVSCLFRKKRETGV